MAGSGAQRVRGAILVAAVLAAGAFRPPAAAAAEERSLVLPGTTLSAVTVDLDGDGEREIVRLVQEERRVDPAVDAWEHDGDSWSVLGSAPMPDADAGEEAPAEFGGQAVALLPWQVAGREHLLAFSAAIVPNNAGGVTCCLTISEVRLTRGGIAIQLLQRVESGTQSVLTADVDGDGSDELVLHEQFGTAEGTETATLTVLRWNGSRFEQMFEETDSQWLAGISIAESDGVAGDDLLFAPSADGSLRRLAWADGELRVDEAHIDLGGRQDGWVVGVADGAILLSLVEEARVIRWARGEDPVTVNRLPTLTYPGLTLVGEGPDALVVLQDGFAFERERPPTVTMYDLDLRLLGEVGASPGTEGFWRLANGDLSSAMHQGQRNVFPYTGPLYGALGDGRDAFVASGTLIQPGGPDGYEARPMASLIGMQPIGIAGPRERWAVMSDGFGAPPGSAYLAWGGIPPGLGRLTVTPLDHLLRPDEDAVAALIEPVNAVEVARDGAVATLLADGDGFQAVITATTGSTVIVANGRLLEEHEVGDEPLIVEILPPRNSADDVNRDFEAAVLVIAPDGRGTSQRWIGTFVRELPEVSVTATTNALSLSATLDGRASAGSQLTANGRPIETDEDGRFAASIDAPIWPSQIVMTARDPLGNETTKLIEVVGAVDYRGLPWAAIMVAATLVVGGVLYVRTPRRRAVATASDGDGRLEELELDAIESIESGRR